MQTPQDLRPRILVVDDNEDMRRTMQMLLDQEGYEVESAADGSLALEIQKERPVSLVITDLLMPEKDGIETIEHFRREFPDVKIIAMSGGGARIRGERYLVTAGVAGADAVLRKPFQPSELMQALRSVMPVPPALY